MRLLIFYFVLLGFLPVIAYSQEISSCAENLQTAQSLFDRGQVDQVPSMLYDCMKTGFNREESLAAYKLLIQSYLFNDELEIADSTMLAFLKKNPEYEISPTDHSSFVHLFNKFKVKPVVQLSFHMGTNLPFLTFVDEETVASEPGNSRYNMEAINLFTSVEAKFELNKKLEINFEAGYSQFTINNLEDFLLFSKTDYTEKFSRLEIPVSATYNIMNLGKFTPFVRLGAGTALTLGSSAKATSDPTDINNPDVHTGPDIDRTDSRIFMDFFAQAGAGMKFKTPRGFINAEVRSNFGILSQIVRGGSSVVDVEELRWHYYFVDDDFHFNSMNISVGYTHIFYKSSKREE